MSGIYPAEEFNLHNPALLAVVRSFLDQVFAHPSMATLTQELTRRGNTSSPYRLDFDNEGAVVFAGNISLFPWEDDVSNLWGVDIAAHGHGVYEYSDIGQYPTFKRALREAMRAFASRRIGDHTLSQKLVGKWKAEALQPAGSETERRLAARQPPLGELLGEDPVPAELQDIEGFVIEDRWEILTAKMPHPSIVGAKFFNELVVLDRQSDDEVPSMLKGGSMKGGLDTIATTVFLERLDAVLEDIPEPWS